MYCNSYVKYVTFYTDSDHAYTSSKNVYTYILSLVHLIHRYKAVCTWSSQASKIWGLSERTEIAHWLAHHHTHTYACTHTHTHTYSCTHTHTHNTHNRQTYCTNDQNMHTTVYCWLPLSRCSVSGDDRVGETEGKRGVCTNQSSVSASVCVSLLSLHSGRGQFWTGDQEIWGGHCVEGKPFYIVCLCVSLMMMASFENFCKRLYWAYIHVIAPLLAE